MLLEFKGGCGGPPEVILLTHLEMEGTLKRFWCIAGGVVVIDKSMWIYSDDIDRAPGYPTSQVRSFACGFCILGPRA